MSHTCGPEKEDELTHLVCRGMKVTIKAQRFAVVINISHQKNDEFRGLKLRQV